MKTVRRLLYRDVVASVLFVAVAFLSLLFFIDFLDELDAAGSGGRNAWQAFQGAMLLLPSNLYELFPNAVLIGTIYALARLAQSSEFTILRTSGLGPGRALGLLATLGVGFALLTFVVGDYLAPAAQRQAVFLKARPTGGVAAAGGTAATGAGAWLKERRPTPLGEHSFSVNVGGASAAGKISGIRIYEFDSDGRLVSRTQAREARIDSASQTGVAQWTLTDVEVTRWPTAVMQREAGATVTSVMPIAASAAAPSNSSAVALSSLGERAVQVQKMPTLAWPSTLTAGVVSAAVLPVNTMSTLELWRYSTHLDHQEQASQTHQIRFWRKALYPLACLVMVALALPFAYLHARAGGISLKVFGGVMLGISFALLSNLSGQLGMLRGWTPWVAAAAPSLLYLLMSMGAFAWLVRYR